MKKPLAAIVATLAAVAIATTASAATIAVHDDEPDRSSRSMTSTEPGSRSAPGDRSGGMMRDRSGGMMSNRGGGMMSNRGGGMMSGRSGGQMMSGSIARDEFSYLTHMVAHHEEAVDAAEELARSERPRMREFGRSIVASQSAQIDQMNSWLETWYPGRSTDVDYEPMMRDLSELSGAKLDRAFLQDMMVHHMGAVMMSQQLLARNSADHAQVETLAATIRDEQHAEIFQMQRWLASWHGEDWPRGSSGSPRGSAGMGSGMMG